MCSQVSPYPNIRAIDTFELTFKKRNQSGSGSGGGNGVGSGGASGGASASGRGVGSGSGNGSGSGRIQKESSKNEKPSISLSNQLKKLEEEIRKFSSDAESSFRKKQEELMRPIMLKIDRSVREVATENDYSIIINTSISGNQNLLMFGAPAYDVSDLVLKKMGVTINQHKR